MDSKLKCTFVLPEGNEMNNGTSSGAGTATSSIIAPSEHQKQGAVPPSPKVSGGHKSRLSEAIVDDIEHLHLG